MVHKAMADMGFELVPRELFKGMGIVKCKRNERNRIRRVVFHSSEKKKLNSNQNLVLEKYSSDSRKLENRTFSYVEDYMLSVDFQYIHQRNGKTARDC
jgi:hypothetical protein